MYCVRNVTPDLIWLGGSDRRLSLFEGAHPVPNGMAYNAYLLADEKTALFDTVDKAIAPLFFENLAYALQGRPLDYVVVQHVEPDHSATLGALLIAHPEAQVVCTAKAQTMIKQFLHIDLAGRAAVVKEGDTLCLGRHTLAFMMAPMVHWPEVMVTYDQADRTLFSADAFGLFGALDGALFADEVNFARDHMDELRRYYANIVGKYGQPVQGLLKKAKALQIECICPLHGFVWRGDFDLLLQKYDLWSRYEPEEQGVLIAYASVYGNTANAAEIVAARLRAQGVSCAVYDVSVTDPSVIVSEAFRYSHLVFAAPTYNNGIFVKMEDVLHDIAAHALQNRTVALIQNGSWAPASGAQMQAILSALKGVTVLEPMLTLKSALAPEQDNEVESFVSSIIASMGGNA